MRLVGSVADHFARRSAEFGGYQVLPKPFVLEGRRASLPGTWPKLMQETVVEIRKHDTDHWILVTPGPAGLPKGYRHFAPLSDPKVIYTANMYAPPEYTRQGVGHRPRGVVYPGQIGVAYWDGRALVKVLRPLRSFEKGYGVPVLIDEFGAVRWAPGSDRYLPDLARIFGNYQWGWSYFGFKQGPAWNPDAEAISPADGSANGADGHVGGGAERWATLQDIFTAYGAGAPAPSVH